VRIDLDATDIVGSVVVGNATATGGFVRLVETHGSGGTTPIIVSRSGAGGLTSEMVVGGASEFVSLVDENGRYAIDGVPPKSYRAYYVSGSSNSLSLDLVVPDVEQWNKDLVFSGGAIFGTVFDDQMRGVPDAEVRIVGTQSGTSSHANGSFEISGLSQGSYSISAANADAVSEDQVVEIRDSDSRVHADLILKQRTSTVNVVVQHPLQGPVQGAFVFLDGGSIIATGSTDSAGMVEITIPPGTGDVFCVAAWAGGLWAASTCTSGEQCVLGLPQLAGSIVIPSSENTCYPAVIHEDGLDLVNLLRILGVYLQTGPEGDLVIQGLPAARYTVSVCNASDSVVVREGGLVIFEP